MGLTGALELGRTGILTAQSALQVTGDNIANAATPGYHRRVVQLAPTADQQIQQGIFLGTGVKITDVRRQINQALESRLRGATADQSGAQITENLLGQIQSVESSYSGSSLSDQLTAFFNQWSQLSNNPQDLSQRSLVVQQGQTLANYIGGLRASLTNVRTQLDQSILSGVTAVNDLLDQIAQLNKQISSSGSPSPSLMDQRDALLGTLSKSLDISTVQQANGATEVYVGSTPLILGSTNRGVALQKKTVKGQTQEQLVVKADNTPLGVSSGELGAQLQFREGELPDAIAKLDTFANQLIFQVNRIHSQSQGLVGISSITGDSRVADATAALNSSAAGLKFTLMNGSFKVSVVDPSTGQRTSSVVHVNLTGTGGDTTLNSLVTDLNGITGMSASVTADGRLKISASGDDTLSFSDDSSGALAALGINSFFSGTDATNIAVDGTVAANSRRLAISQNFLPGDNSGAVAVAGLSGQAATDLGGLSLSDYWKNHVEDVATKLNHVKQQASADGVVHDNLQQQQQAVSGVNTNDEAISLMQNQQAFAASAKFITTVDRMMQTLMQML